jgi:LCP family protein required for cell wall assembly
MRTTLKRGVGRGAGANGNGRAVFPPGPLAAITLYRQPPPPGRTAMGVVRRIIVGTLIVVSSIALAVAGGAYLWLHESVSAVQAHTPEVKRAAKVLDVPVANKAAIALVIGYDHRAGQGNAPSRSDTLMLIRADPQTKTISLLSFPRDLQEPLYCGHSASDTVGHVVATDRINAAYAYCGPKGTLLTVKHLTGLPINYLITVNFHGFKEIVDKIGGIWMDVDRRYYNKNTGAYYDNYANINLLPGYQLLSGSAALDFVRFRHTDSDLYRLARQQEFIRSFREQIAKTFSFTELPGLVSTITKSVEVGEGGHALQPKQVLSYALFAADLPSGHVFQDRFENVDCPPAGACSASSSDIQAAVNQFETPDVETPKAANAAALGQRLKRKAAPRPSSVTLTVLNGNGISGAAANTSYLLAQRGYRTLVPPNQLKADAPQRVFHTKVYYDPTQRRARAAAIALKTLLEPADVAPLPRQRALRALDPGSMLLVVLGESFPGTVASAPVRTVPTHHPAYVRFDGLYGAQLLRPLQRKAGFPLEAPTVLERSSYPDTLPGDKPSRLYWIDGRGHHKAVRLVFRTGANAFWGIEETDWNDAPVLSDKSFRHRLSGRVFDLYYSGTHLHMVVLHARGATYWVINSLRDDLSNETMLAIAKGLKPLTSVK